MVQMRTGTDLVGFDTLKRDLKYTPFCVCILRHYSFVRMLKCVFKINF